MARFSTSSQNYSRAIALGTQTALTVSCWFRVAVDRDTYSTLFFVDNGTSDNWGVQAGADGTTVATVFDASTQQGMGSVAVGTWYYICLATNGTTGTLYWKAAGAPTLNVVTVTSVTASVNAATLRIGESPWGGEWLNGSIAAFKLWAGVALTAAEVQQESQQYAPIRRAGLAAYYPLLSADPADQSGNDRTLSGSGATTDDGPPIPLRPASLRRFLSAAVAGSGNPVALDGMGSASNGATGSLDGGRAFAGLSPAAASATGSASVDRPLAGISPAAASATGSLAAERPFDGVSAAAAGAVGALDTARPLAGIAASTSGAGGDLSVVRPLGGSADSASSGGGALSAARPLAGLAPAAAGATGDLTLSGQVGLDGTAPTASFAAGGLSTARPLAGIAGTADSADGQLGATRGLAGTAAGSSEATADLVEVRALVGLAAAASGATGDLDVTNNTRPLEYPVLAIGRRPQSTWECVGVEPAWTAGTNPVAVWRTP